MATRVIEAGVDISFGTVIRLTAGLDSIIQCAFGTERAGMIEADEKIVRQHMQRLLICRVENGKMPYDIVHAIACKTMRPMAYESKSRDILPFTACAVIRKYYWDHKQREFDGVLGELTLFYLFSPVYFTIFSITQECFFSLS